MTAGKNISHQVVLVPPQGRGDDSGGGGGSGQQGCPGDRGLAGLCSV